MSGVFLQDLKNEFTLPPDAPDWNAAGNHSLCSQHDSSPNWDAVPSPGWLFRSRCVRRHHALQLPDPAAAPDPGGYELRTHDLEDLALSGFGDGSTYYLHTGERLWRLTGQYNEPGWRRDRHLDGGNLGYHQSQQINPKAEIYQLYGEDSQVAVSFVKLSEDLLHVLNKDGTLMAGNAAWSYTLNRTNNQSPVKVEPVSEPPLPTRPPIPTTPPGSSVLGVFEGRLPCHELVFELLGITPYPGCMKLKSRLTLHMDQGTGAPGTYVYLGTHTIREGTWTILQGMEDDPDAVIYQLESSKGFVSFLKADENHLFLLDEDLNLMVGNALFSYTLSRIEQNK
jgi:hypothetical protein